jgi:fumarate hydratase class II
MAATRTEHDSLGPLEVPADAYFGIQTQRAIANFPISGTPMPRAFIHAHVMLKKAAAIVNRDLGLLKPELAAAITQAADEILADAEWSRDQFPVDVYQTGSGTSTNMNVNEVLASRANEILGHPRRPVISRDSAPSSGAPDGNPGAPRLDAKPSVHPNDHVNLGQSSNDTIPTSMQLMAARMIHGNLNPAMLALRTSLGQKSAGLWNVIKTGRTHLQDATPIRLGQEFEGYADQILICETNFILSKDAGLLNLPIGGTAVGTGVNAHPEFSQRVCRLLSQWCDCEMSESPYHFSAQATLDVATAAHGLIKSLAVSLTKIANDIRWMASGPIAGLGEIEIPAVQPGSSIMPGKVNPVICESVLMVCQRVIGNDAALTAAACQNNFELAMSMPLAAHLLHESITLLANACRNFATQCIDGIKATSRGPELVEKGLMLATALAPVIGHEKAAEIAKDAAKTGRTIREVAREKTDLTDEQLAKLLDPTTMV